jgi:DNA-binding transcriptional MerR regulator
MALDTLKFARKLQEAGMSPKQAEAQAEAIQEALEGAAVTKADLADHRAELRTELAELRDEIAELRTEMRTDITELRGKLALLYWMLGFNLALTASVLAKLLIVR